MVKASKNDYLKPHSGNPTNKSSFSMWIRTTSKGTNPLLRWWIRPKR